MIGIARVVAWATERLFKTSLTNLLSVTLLGIVSSSNPASHHLYNGCWLRVLCLLYFLRFLPDRGSTGSELRARVGNFTKKIPMSSSREALESLCHPLHRESPILLDGQT